ncbi:MAG: hypothetical protein KGI37_01880 [Alphaproteobacteria bacterium]|nr:hypothetical protein [Alphaproteobacteria bacterium]
MKKPSLVIAILTLLAFAPLALAMPAWADPDVLSKGDSKDGGKSAGDEAPKNTKKNDGGITGGRFAGDPIYVHIDPMVLPVIDANGVEQIVTLLFQVQVKDFDAADQMQSHMPQIMDALMQNLYGQLGSGVLRNGKLVNVVKVKQRAIAAVSGVIGAKNVSDVLVQGISQRML